MAKLKKYAAAYNINVDRVVEKDDLIDAIIAARVCLLSETCHNCDQADALARVLMGAYLLRTKYDSRFPG